MSFIDQHVGRALRRRREALAIARDELAGLLCIPTEALKRQEEGGLYITGAQLKELTHLLGVDVSFFFESLLAKLEERAEEFTIKTTPVDDGHFILSLLRVLDRIADAVGIETKGYLKRAADEVERAISPNVLDRHVGSRLRMLREEAGLSEEALSGALGLTVETLRRMEAGEERIDRTTLLAACPILIIEPEQLSSDPPCPFPTRRLHDPFTEDPDGGAAVGLARKPSGGKPGVTAPASPAGRWRGARSKAGPLPRAAAAAA
jgi:transcriptional regulator with XRE-family HTH domain